MDESQLGEESTQLDEIIADFIFAEEAGEDISREALLQAHPEYAEELEQFFADRDRFKRLASPLGPEVSRHSDLPTTVKYFGDYELLEQIAQGGMGVVYKARQKSLNRIVAVKMILAGHLATDDDIKRFTGEAKTAATLKHRAIVPIHEVGQQNGQHYFSMDYIEGRSLAEIIRTEPPSIEDSVKIVQAIAEAVDYAHQEGIVHRDLKPSNILIDAHGQVHITDFGLALRVEGDSELTRTGQILGTPSYMSPEQATAKRDLIGPASDIYSLGTILYELLTGRPPFRGETAADTIRQLLDSEPISPRQLNPKVTRDLETICLKCLQKEPHQRYGTAALLADDLGRYASNEPILARPVGYAERLLRWCRREPKVASLATAVALLLIAGTCVSTYFALDAYRQRDVARLQETIANQARLDAEDKQQQAIVARQKEAAARKSEAQRRKEADAARKLAEERLKQSHWHLYLSRLKSMQQLWKEREFGHLERSLHESIPRVGEPDYRGWEWQFLQDQVSRASRRVCGDENYSGFFTCDANRSRVLCEGDEKWDLWNLDENARIGSFQLKMCRPETAELSPDGSMVAWGTWDRRVRIIDLGTNTLLQDINAHPEDEGPQTWMADVAWSPSGKQIASMTRRGRVKVWDVQTGKLVTRLTEESQSTEANSLPVGGQIDWHDRGGLASTFRNGVHVWDVENSRLKWTAKIGRRSVREVHWNPSGTRLAFAGDGVAIHGADGSLVGQYAGMSVDSVLTWVTDDRYAVASIQDLRVGDCNLQLSEPIRIHSGRIPKLAGFGKGHVLTASVNGPCRLVSLDFASPTHQRVDACSGTVHRVVWSPDGQLAATAGGGEARVWNADTLKLLWSLRSPTGSDVRDIAWNHSDNRITTIHRGGEINFWNGKTGKRSGTIHVPVVGKIACNRVEPQVVVVSSRTCLLRIPTGQEIWTDTEGRNSEMMAAFSPDGKLICAESNNGTAWLYDTATGEKVFRDRRARRSAGRGTGVAWSPDGRLFAVGHNSVHVYSSKTKELAFELVGHRGSVRDFAFDPSGSRIASVGEDDRLIIWDVTKGQCLVELDTGVPGGMRSVSWSPDGQRIATGDVDGVLRIWGTNSGRTQPESTPFVPRRRDNSIRQKLLNELADLTAQLQLKPHDRETLKNRATLLMKLQDWDKSAADWEDLLAVGEHKWGRGLTALTYAMLGDDEKYSAHCHQLHSLIEGWEPGTTVLAGIALSLRPSVLNDYEEVLRRVEKNAQGKSNWWWAEHPRLGLLFRSERYDDALQLATEFQARDGKPGPAARAVHLLYAAMAHQKRSQHAEAKMALKKALEIIQNEVPQPGEYLKNSVVQWIECQVIRREAEEMILGKREAP